MESEQKQQTNQEPSAEGTLELSLNQDQLAYINSLLPFSYSLQICHKPSRKQIKQQTLSIKKHEKKKNTLKRDDSDASGTPTRQIKSRKSIDEVISVKEQPQRSLQENNSNVNYQFEGDPEMSSCFYILMKLKRHECAEPFLQEVDPIALGVPDYLKVIKQPMDLGLIERNLRTNQYQTPTQFHADINKIFSNSYKYNNKSTDVYKLTVQLQRFYNKMIAEITMEQNASELHNRLSIVNRRVSEYLAVYAPRKKKKHQQERVLSDIQINNLSEKIKALPNTCIAEVLKIVTESRSYLSQPIRNIQEVDLNELEMNVLVELDRYIRLKISPNPRKRRQKGQLKKVLQQSNSSTKVPTVDTRPTQTPNEQISASSQFQLQVE